MLYWPFQASICLKLDEWPALRQLCRDEKLSANDIPDAWIAAAVKATHGRLITFDRGFKRLLGKDELTLLSVTG